MKGGLIKLVCNGDNKTWQILISKQNKERNNLLYIYFICVFVSFHIQKENTDTLKLWTTVIIDRKPNFTLPHNFYSLFSFNFDWCVCHLFPLSNKHLRTQKVFRCFVVNKLRPWRTLTGALVWLNWTSEYVVFMIGQVSTLAVVGASKLKDLASTFTYAKEI